MNVYQKLNAAREEFHTLKLNKTGHNKFAGNYYFELGDFLIPALKVFAKHGLCAAISFNKDIATMNVVNVDKPEEKLTFESPMGSAALKGCHEVQNIGAVETYQRRYLWVAALEVVEHDALDATTGKDKGVLKQPALMGIGDDLPLERKQIIEAVASAMLDHFDANDVQGAYEEYLGVEDDDEKLFLWRKLPSKLRTAVRKHGELANKTPATQE